MEGYTITPSFHTASMDPSDHFHNHPPSLPVNNLRAPRARNDRPCDYCRRLKQLCTIEIRGQPCIMCKKRNKNCTFEAPPTKRQRRELAQRERGDDLPRSMAGGTTSDFSNSIASSSMMDFEDPQASGSGNGYHSLQPRPQALPLPRSSITATLQSLRLHSGIAAQDVSDTCSDLDSPLDIEEDESNEESHYLGPGALSEIVLSPYILRNVSNHPAMAVSSSTPSTFRQVSRDPLQPVFFVKNVSVLFGKVGDGGKETFQWISAIYDQHGLSWHNALEMFIENSLPAVPILNNVRLRGACSSWGGAGSFPYALLSGIMAHVLIYRKDLRNIAPDMWKRILPLLDDEYRHPSLRTLQLSLINLVSRPSSNHGGNAIELARAIGTAHLLGLHIDSSSWTLPRWERSVRKRLWWSLVIEDKWRSLLYSRPSNLHRSNNNVPLPTAFDDDWGALEASDSDIVPGAAKVESKESFILMCKMTVIIEDIFEEYYTPKPELSMAGRLMKIETLSGDLDRILADWPDGLKPLAGMGMEGHSFATGVRLAQLTVLGLRVIINKLILDSYIDLPCPSELLLPFVDGCEDIARFLETFDQADCDSFWPTYAYCHITNAISLLLQTAHYSSNAHTPTTNTSATESQSEPSSLALVALRRLLTVTRQLVSLHQWEVAEPAVAKAKALLTLMEPMLPAVGGLKELTEWEDSKTVEKPGPGKDVSGDVVFPDLGLLQDINLDTLEAQQEFFALLWQTST